MRACHCLGSDRSSRGPHDYGFSVLELLVVLGIVGTLIVASVVIRTQVLPAVRADSVMQMVQGKLFQTRQMAMDQHCNFTFTFRGNNEIVVVRQELSPPAPPHTTTPIADYFLPYGASYNVFASVPDTPDGLGRAQAVNFNCGGTLVTSIVLRSDGSIQDGNDNFCSGTVFMGIGTNTLTARSVTVLGVPARIRSYRYDGSAWN